MRWPLLLADLAVLPGCAWLGPDLAFKAPVSVSSQHAGAAGESAASALTDGDQSSRWSSAYADHQWIVVDLRRSQQVGLLCLRWETASARDYRVELSDDRRTWRLAGGRKGAAAGPRLDEIPLQGDARYVRVDLDARATRWGFSLYEIMVFPNHR